MAFPQIALIAQWATNGDSNSHVVPVFEGPSFSITNSEASRGVLAAIQGSGGYPTVGNVNSHTDTTGTSHTINLPANIATGDLLIVAFTKDGSGAGGWPSSPAWTVLEAGNDGSSTSHFEVRYRVVDGSEGWSSGNTITITTGVNEGTSSQTLRISTGTFTGTPQSVTSTATSDAGGMHGTGSLLPSWTGETLFLALCGFDGGNLSVSGPLLYTDFTVVDTGNAGGAVAASARRQVNVPAIADILTIVFWHRDGSGSTAPSWAVGWDVLTEGGGAAASEAQGSFVSVAKRARQSGDAATVTIAPNVTDSGCAIVLGLIGWHGDITAASVVGASSAGTSADPPEVTAAWGSDDNLFIAFAGHDDGSDSFTGGPTNYSPMYQWSEGSSNGSEIAIALRQLAAASDDPSAFTISASEEWAAGTIVIRPAAGTGTTYEDSITLASDSDFAIAGVLSIALPAMLAVETEITVSPAGSTYGVTITLPGEVDALLDGAARIDVAAALGAESGFAAMGGLRLDAALALAAETDLATVGTFRLDQAIALGAATDLAAAARVIAQPAVTFAAEADFDAVGTIRIDAAATLAAEVDLAAAGTLSTTQALTFAVDADMAAGGGLRLDDTLMLSAEAAIAAASGLALVEAIALAAETDLNAAALLEVVGSISLASSAAHAAAAQLTARPSVALNAEADIDAANSLTVTAAGNFAFTADMALVAILRLDGAISLGAEPGIDASGGLLLLESVEIGAGADITAAAGLAVFETLALGIEAGVAIVGAELESLPGTVSILDALLFEVGITDALLYSVGVTDTLHQSVASSDAAAGGVAIADERVGSVEIGDSQT